MISEMWARLEFKKRTIRRPEQQSNGRKFLKLSIGRKTVAVDP